MIGFIYYALIFAIWCLAFIAIGYCYTIHQATKRLDRTDRNTFLRPTVQSDKLLGNPTIFINCEAYSNSEYGFTVSTLPEKVSGEDLTVGLS